MLVVEEKDPGAFFAEKCGMTSIYWLLRPYFFPVIPSCFFICHSGLRAGVQVNIDSSATWIPGQARNDRKKMSPE